MRLDHLLSREFRAPAQRWDGALQAPMVDRTVVRFPSQVGSAGARKGIGDRGDLARITETGRASKFIRTFLPLFKGQGCRAPASSTRRLGEQGPGDADGGHAKAPVRTVGERTQVREPRTAAGNAGGAVRFTAGGRLAQLVRALP